MVQPLKPTSMMQFVLVSSVCQERGLVGYEALPDLIHDFSVIAKGYGAITCHLDDGSLVATKGSLSVSLSIRETVEIFPSRNLIACIEEMMSRCFGE